MRVHWKEGKSNSKKQTKRLESKPSRIDSSFPPPTWTGLRLEARILYQSAVVTAKKKHAEHDIFLSREFWAVLVHRWIVDPCDISCIWAFSLFLWRGDLQALRVGRLKSVLPQKKVCNSVNFLRYLRSSWQRGAGIEVLRRRSALKST